MDRSLISVSWVCRGSRRFTHFLLFDIPPFADARCCDRHRVSASFLPPSRFQFNRSAKRLTKDAKKLIFDIINSSTVFLPLKMHFSFVEFSNSKILRFFLPDGSKIRFQKQSQACKRLSFVRILISGTNSQFSRWLTIWGKCCKIETVIFEITNDFL